MLFADFISQPLIFLAFIIALLIALTFHEIAHGLVAYWLGDNTAKDLGRLSPNPLKHLDPLGTVLLLLVGFGWGKPVPVNYYNLKYQKWGPALVSFAGPLSNLIMAVAAGLAFKLLTLGVSVNPIFTGLSPAYVASMEASGYDLNLAHFLLSFLLIYNIILMIFNLIPIPPLDGSKILFALLPSKYDNFKQWFQARGAMLLFVLLFLDAIFNLGIFGVLFFGILNFVARLF